MPTVLTIHIYKAGQLAGSRHFDSRTQRVVKIGRIGSAHLQVDEPDVARVHAVIELTHTQAKLIDMGSQIGTLVNGARVSKAMLKSDDQIVIGTTGLLVGVDVQRDGVAAVAPAAAPAQTPVAAPQPVAQETIAAQPLVADSAPGPAAALPPSPPPDATPNAPNPSAILAERITTKIAALPPESQQTVETFIDLLASRPAGINIHIGSGSMEGPADGRTTPARRDTASMIAISGIGRSRRLIAVAAAALAIVALAFLATRLWDNKDSKPPRDPWSLEVEKGASTDGKTPEKPAAPKPDPEPRDPNFVYVELTGALSLRDLATKLWPTVDRAALLLESNPSATGLDDAQAAGSTIRLPRKLPFRVRPGDSLAVIAKSTLGDAQLYPVIFEANRDVMSSPSAADVGMLLEIPLLHEAVRTKLAELGKIEPDADPE